MSTHSKLRELTDKYESELNELKSNGETGKAVEVLESFLNDLEEVETYASWSEFPEDMGR